MSSVLTSSLLTQCLTPLFVCKNVCDCVIVYVCVAFGVLPPGTWTISSPVHNHLIGWGGVGLSSTLHQIVPPLW